MDQKGKKQTIADHPIWEKGRKTQPAGLFAIFSMLGIAVLFFTIMVMFSLASPEQHLDGQQFPKLFCFSTPLILLCSCTIEKTKNAFCHHNSDALLKWQLYTLALSLAFCVMQFFAWQQLWDTSITMTQNASESARVSALALY